MSPDVCEGFFAEVAVLVEGVSDKAALEAAATLEGIDLQERGVSIVPCGSANNLDRPATIFGALGIPTYVVWDGDLKTPADVGVVRRNLALQRLLAVPAGSYANYPGFVRPNGACFLHKLETTLRDELTSTVFDTLLEEQKTNYAFERHRDVLKVPRCMTDILVAANTQGKRSTTLAGIVQAIVSMSNAAQASQANQAAEVDALS
jgi:predicted ATP-dependent endonuclease of OLD family